MWLTALIIRQQWLVVCSFWSHENSLSSCNCRRSANKYLQINQQYNSKDILHTFQLSDMLLYLKHLDINKLIHAAGFLWLLTVSTFHMPLWIRAMNTWYALPLTTLSGHLNINQISSTFSSIVLWNSPLTIFQFFISYIPPSFVSHHPFPTLSNYNPVFEMPHNESEKSQT
jgi:hypothetical protein